MRSTPGLDCYLFDGWKPRIQPAQRRRAWMDATPESFAYRCLPLAIANAHGWEVGNGVGFRARWTGGSGVEDVEIELDAPCEPIDEPVSLFGQGVITFHVAGLFRTSPGWNLWVGGPPNHIKDGVAPLSGIIETDWSPYSFTMNWRFTRPDHWVRFEADEPICFFLPIERGVVDTMEPRFLPIADAPELEKQFRTWSASRDAFQAKVKADPPASPSDKWQKLYYRGVDANGRPGVADHQSKLRATAFLASSREHAPPVCPIGPPPTYMSDAYDSDRLLDIQQELRSLAPPRHLIERVNSIEPERFLDRHYAANWPLHLRYRLTRALSDGVSAVVAEWKTTSEAGASRMVDAPVDCLAETDTAPFDGVLAPIGADATLRLRAACAGSVAPLAQERANRFYLQLAGRSRLLLAPPPLSRALQSGDPGALLAPDTAAARLSQHCRLSFDLMVEPGEAVFVPVGWWSQTHALEDSVSLSRTDFRWRNDWGGAARSD